MDQQNNTRPRPEILERITNVPGLRVIHGQNVAFIRRRTVMHADYAIKLTVSGSGAPYRYRGADYAPCCEGDVSVFDPFEPVIATESTRTTNFVTLMVDPCLVLQAHESRERKGRPIFAPANAVRLPLIHELLAVHEGVVTGCPAADLEKHLVSALDLLLEVSQVDHSRSRTSPPAAVIQSRELILDRLTENFGLQDLEEATGYSRFHLMRLFRKHYGLTLHDFRLRARVALAMRLLASGRPQADVAAEVGFFDQSHFQRHFRRIVGMPPGQFVR